MIKFLRKILPKKRVPIGYQTTFPGLIAYNKLVRGEIAEKEYANMKNLSPKTKVIAWKEVDRI